ncbi:6-bladed beta-propeller [Parabacteroides distasonis]|uniref:6-bladed beta-propeller n=1 Tax=Parabacteroides distasonis TaxID=823 RepID=A0A3L7ZNQ9_PARDI|nr:6-bladed beta-propeller [Parabacteroides distasonis]NBH89001.1 6-bladed beta-propeller [Parabacteroides distasonis]RLT73554.1 6-bladed beta-propeller [Parabacteroides distasonis]
MRLRYVFFLLFSFYLIACQDKVKVADIPIVDFGNNRKESLLDIFECQFIPLSTDSLLLGQIDIVKFVDRRIFILDSKRTKGLYVFSDNGEFITKVSSFGDGPTEYSSLSTFFIDEEKRILILSDFNKAYLRYYDLDTYQYISCDKFDFYTDCAPLGDNRWAWYMPRGFVTPKRESYYLKITDVNNETISLLNPTYFVSPHVINPSSHFHQYQGNTFIHFPFSATVWNVEKDTSLIAYEISFGDKKMPPIDYMKKIGKDKRDYTAELFRSDYVYTYKLYEQEDYLQITYMFGKSTYFGFYNKNKKTTFTYEFPEFIRATGLAGFRGLIGTYNDYFVGYIDPGVLKRNYTPHANLQELSDKAKEDDNPILCLFKFKK